ncbi:nuclear transport factor 2 family protein [Hyphomonas sp.]|uniref:nuclear transport factor 2 family protein n=1 Tax=Hyphomonas sp. TaxID=87 RepID=UPI0025C6364F|nr:nuclear transport factor 2 family protein [Hyphomonas sp.]
MLAEAGAFDAWLAAYARAQDGGDVALLGSLFSDNAKFFETPFHAPIEGREAISDVFAAVWARLTDVSFEIEKISDGWAHWTSGAIIEALDEPQRSNGILKADLDDEGRCSSLTFWTERLSVREADMLAQRDA